MTGKLFENSRLSVFCSLGTDSLFSGLLCCLWNSHSLCEVSSSLHLVGARSMFGSWWGRVRTPRLAIGGSWLRNWKLPISLLDLHLFSSRLGHFPLCNSFLVSEKLSLVTANSFIVRPPLPWLPFPSGAWLSQRGTQSSQLIFPISVSVHIYLCLGMLFSENFFNCHFQLSFLLIPYCLYS